LVSLITGIIQFLIGIAIRRYDLDPVFANYISPIIAFLGGSGIYGVMVKEPESNASIGFVKGMLISLTFCLFFVVIGLILVGFSV